MKKCLLGFIIGLTILSCKNNGDIETITINPNELSLGPIVHDSLSNLQLEKITYIQKTFEEILPVSLEETITNFKRDQNPDKEIEIWLQMAKTYQLFASKYPKEDEFELRKEAFGLILSISMADDDEAIENAKLNLLNPEQISEILSNYTLKAKPLEINKNN